MKNLSAKSLTIPEIKIIRYERFLDNRGYFSETFNHSEFNNNAPISSIAKKYFVQANESFSKKNTIRGLHFQWNPYMGKMVRTISGRMIDLALDIRKKSPTFGKIIAYEMPARPENESNEWIWVPPGFAHGNLFLEDSIIEYLCTGEYNNRCEAGISPLSSDIDWSLIDNKIKILFDEIVSSKPIISDKDKNAMSLRQWLEDDRSDNFIFEQI